MREDKWKKRGMEYQGGEKNILNKNKHNVQLGIIEHLDSIFFVYTT